MGKSSKSSSLEQDLDSLRVDFASIKDDVASLAATLKSILDSMPSKEELLAMVTSIQELSKKVAKIPAASVAQVNSSSKDHKKAAEADTNTPRKESSSNVSSKESDTLEKGTLKRMLLPCSSSDNRLEKTAEKSDEGEEPAKKKAKSDINYTYKKANITRPFPVYADAHPLEKNAQVGEIVEFERQPGGSCDGGILFVKGYDSSLSEDDIAEAMLEHFCPCGMIRRIYFQTNGTTPILRHVFVEMLQGTVAALKLNGSDLGGFKLEVHDAKERDEFYFTRDLDFPFIPPKSRRHERWDPSRFTKESPPVYGIVSSSKINK
ncbi:PREDICTED: nucleolin 2 [Camelina sativa]|uniref:Nucleolin 2 n=1 Tax=Camelina sativa TaxID=90675 RepID=A0ABM0UN85_CAMSA|nr:PREDICTED: nucleolin 2 [Camelina sativa]